MKISSCISKIMTLIFLISTTINSSAEDRCIDPRASFKNVEPFNSFLEEINSIYIETIEITQFLISIFEQKCFSAKDIFDRDIHRQWFNGMGILIN